MGGVSERQSSPLDGTPLDKEAFQDYQRLYWIQKHAEREQQQAEKRDRRRAQKSKEAQEAYEKQLRLLELYEVTEGLSKEETKEMFEIGTTVVVRSAQAAWWMGGVVEQREQDGKVQVLVLLNLAPEDSTPRTVTIYPPVPDTIRIPVDRPAVDTSARTRWLEALAKQKKSP